MSYFFIPPSPLLWLSDLFLCSEIKNRNDYSRGPVQSQLVNCDVAVNLAKLSFWRCENWLSVARRVPIGEIDKSFLSFARRDRGVKTWSLALLNLARLIPPAYGRVEGRVAPFH